MVAGRETHDWQSSRRGTKTSRHSGYVNQPRFSRAVPLLICHFVDATVAKGGYRAKREQGATGESAAATFLDDIWGRRCTAHEAYLDGGR